MAFEKSQVLRFFVVKIWRGYEVCPDRKNILTVTKCMLDGFIMIVT